MSAPTETVRLLIVEDDPGLSSLLSEYLAPHGFDVHCESRGDQALERIAALQPDLVLLDLMLPGLGGLEICRSARRSYSGGILMLTASKAEADQLVGLELGADDFVLKPVEPRILLARLQALMRRLRPAMKQEEESLSVGALQAQRSSRQANVDRTPLELTGAEFDVLWALMRHTGEVVGREELHRQVRGVAYNGIDRSIDIHVSRLRRKLRAAGLGDAIKAVRGAGYVLTANP